MSGFRISTNVASIAAQRYLAKAQRESEKSLQALASGSRVAQPANDPAGFAIGERLRGQVSGIRQAKFNAESAQSLIQTAEGGLNEQNNILVRLRELAVYSASDTVGDDERGFLNTEFQQLSAEFDRIARSTRYGAKTLLTGTGEEFVFQIGAYKGEENNLKFKLESDTTASNVGIEGLDISDQDEAADSLEEIDDALLKVAGARATFGAVQSRLQYSIDHLAASAENLEAARSQITDADLAEETSKLARNRIIQDAGVLVLAQANSDGGRVSRLLS